MSVTEAFTLHAVNISQESTILSGFTDSRFEAGIKTEGFATDGSIDPTFLATFEENPGLTGTTMSLAAALGALGISGLAITSSPTVFYWAQLDNLGDIAAGSVHLAMTMTTGLHFLQRISARQGAPAELTFGTTPIWDGTNAPVIFAGSQALPEISPLSAVWTVGPVRINGTLFTGVQSIDFDLGLEFSVLRGDGESRPRFGFIRRRKPTIKVTGLNVSVLPVIGCSGVAQSETDSLIYFRAKDDCGDNVADNVASHIGLSIAAGKIMPDSAGARTGEAGTVDLIIEPKYDGSNAIVAVSTGTAIT